MPAACMTRRLGSVLALRVVDEATDATIEHRGGDGELSPALV